MLKNGNITALPCRPKAGDTSSDEESKEVSAASCQERLQQADVHHSTPHTYRKSLRLSSDQIVSALFTFKMLLYHYFFKRFFSFFFS